MRVEVMWWCSVSRRRRRNCGGGVDEQIMVMEASDAVCDVLSVAKRVEMCSAMSRCYIWHICVDCLVDRVRAW